MEARHLPSDSQFLIRNKKSVPRIVTQTGGDDGSEQTQRRQCPQGRGEEAYPAEEKAWRRNGLDQAQQDLRRVHGGQEASEENQGRQEVQGRSAREVMGKLLLVLIVVSIAVLIGLSAWVILL